jgi:DNA-binding IclR family transcriptional regulator
MTATRTAQRSRALELPEGIDSPRAKLVYLYLATADGEVTVTEARATLDLPKLTLLQVLKRLREREFVAREGERYRLTRRSA